MTAAGALALSGVVFLLLAAGWAIAAGDTRNWRTAQRSARTATVLAVIGAACLIVAPWLEVAR